MRDREDVTLPGMEPRNSIIQCPCGGWVSVALTIGPGRKEDGKWILPLVLNEGQFFEDFSAHVMADPANEHHAPFVKAMPDD